MNTTLAQQPSQELKHQSFYHCFIDLPMGEDDISFNIYRCLPTLFVYFYKIPLYDIHIVYYKLF
jgi:hypothetical protein